MSEVLRTVIQNASYVGAGIGYASALVAERKIIKKATEEREAYSEVTGDIVAEQAQNPSIKDRIYKFAGPLALVGALAGGAVGMAYEQEGPAEDSTKLQLIVDKSGATANPEGNKSPSDSINEAIKKFRDEGDATAKIYVAVGGGVLERTADQAIATRPFGDAPIGEAVQSSLDNIQSYSTDKSKSSDTSNAIVVFTNGNNIGDASTVVENAKSTNTTIFVKDVYSSTDSSTRRSIQEIAEKTGGQYFDSGDSVDSYEDVKKKVKEAKSEDNETTKKNDSKEKALIAILALLSVGAVGRARRKMPLTWSGSDIGK